MIVTWLQTIIAVSIVSLISLIGVFSLAIKGEKLKRFLLFMVSFSTGALLGDTFIHLLPEVIGEAGFTLEVSFSLLGGILIFFILEKFICWRHCHIPTSKHHPHPLATMNLVGDGLHNLIDGMVIAGSFLADARIGITTTIAVILHEIPQEISDFGVLLHSGMSEKKAIWFNFLSALTAVVGAIAVLMIGANQENITLFLLPFTAGGFIYIAASDLIPELHKETEPSKSMVQFIGIVLGIFVMLALLLVG
ncbi:MAG: ZIP family metal transporter [archaeon]